MKPTISILDPRFKYRDSASTSVADTWKRHRASIAAQKAKRSAEASADLKAVIDIFNTRNVRKG